MLSHAMPVKQGLLKIVTSPKHCVFIWLVRSTRVRHALVVPRGEGGADVGASQSRHFGVEELLQVFFETPGLDTSHDIEIDEFFGLGVSAEREMAQSFKQRLVAQLVDHLQRFFFSILSS